MKLNEKIYDCRRKAGLSQEALAERLGVSRQAISKWETGEALPEVTKLTHLAQTFGVSVDWLLSEEETPAGESPEEAADNASPQAAAAPAREAHLPDWVDKLPHSLARLIRRYGWIIGLRIAISGAVFTAMGFVAKAMFGSMMNTANDAMSGMGGLGGFGMGSATFYDNAGNVVDPGSLGLSANDLNALGLGGGEISVAAMSNPADIMCSFIIVLGLVMLIGGGLLAWYLKKWGEEN